MPMWRLEDNFGALSFHLVEAGPPSTIVNSTWLVSSGNPLSCLPFHYRSAGIADLGPGGQTWVIRIAQQVFLSAESSCWSVL